MNVADLLKGIPEPTDLFSRIPSIVGGTISGTTLNVNLQFKSGTSEDVRESKATIREMELQLKSLRTEVVTSTQRFNSNCAVLKSDLASQSAAHAGLLRQAQLDIRQLYDMVKNAIDNLLVQLKNIKDSLK